MTSRSALMGPKKAKKEGPKEKVALIPKKEEYHSYELFSKMSETIHSRPSDGGYYRDVPTAELALYKNANWWQEVARTRTEQYDPAARFLVILKNLNSTKEVV